MKRAFLLKIILSFWLLFSISIVKGQYYDYEKTFVQKSAIAHNYKKLLRDFEPISLPFNFPFGTQIYDKIFIYPNGWLSFDPPEKAIYEPAFSGLQTFISPGAYNLKLKNNFYKVRYKDGKDAFIVEWRNIKNPGEYYQVYLYPNGEIEIYLNKETFDNGNQICAVINENSAISNNLDFWNGTGRKLAKISVDLKYANDWRFIPIKEPRNYLGHPVDKQTCYNSGIQPKPNPLISSPKNTVTIGNGTSSTSSPTPYKGYWQDARMQIIYTASELSAAGLNADDIITGIGFNVETVNSTQPYSGFTIRMAHTTQSSFSTTDWVTGVTWTDVYQEDYTVTAGWNVHNFNINNFTWNGTDNIVIEVCFDNTSYTSSDPVYYTTTSNNTVCFAYQDNDVGCTLAPDGTSDSRPNLQIVYTPGGPCTEPSDQPTNLTLTPDVFSITGSFDAAASSPDGYLVVRSTSSSLTSDPVDGTYYNPVDALGGGVVVYRGSNTTFTDNCLDPDHLYYYFIFAYDDYCSTAPDYNVNSPLTGSATTNSFGQPTNLSLSTPSPNEIDGSFTGTNGADGYLVVYSYNSSLSADPVNGTTYNPGDELGGGTVVQADNSTSFSITCIPAGKTYYIYVFAYRNSCTGDPLYNTNSPLTGSISTSPEAADYGLPYYEYFDDASDWTTTGVWEIGDQTDDNYGPPSGVSGYSVAGTALNANYNVNDASDYLTSPSFSLAGVTRPIISFWMDMESESYDGGAVQIQVNGCNWITINYNDPGFSGLVPNDDNISGLGGEGGWSGKIPDGEWDEVRIDLTALTTPGLDNITENDIIRVRFWFGSDGTVSDYPGWYIDNFKIDDLDPCEEPKCATNLHLTPHITSIDVLFQPPDPAPTGYLVIRSTNSTLSEGPSNGTVYNVGDALGGGTVISTNDDFTFTDQGLAQNTTYYYFIYSYNYNDCAGPVYSSCYLTGSATTQSCSNVTVPWSENFDGVTDPNMPDCWTIEDNSAPDDDWETYDYNPRSEPNAMHISYDYDEALDDWAFSPGIYLEAGKNYRLTFYYRAASSSYNESMEVKMGTAANSGSMTTSLWDNPSFNNTDYQLVTIDFNVSSSGTYYFGWHAYSEKNLLGIYVDDINIVETDAPIDIYFTVDNYVFKDRGKQITVYGENLSGINSADFGGYSCTINSTSQSEAVITIPPGDYSSGTLTLSNGTSSASTTLTVKTRNIIPVKAGSPPTSDDHPTPSSAVDGLYAWWQNNPFDTTKIIEIYTGTYADEVIVNSNLNPTATNRLKIRAKTGEQPLISSTGDYGIYTTTDYTDITGLSVSSAKVANIFSTGDNDSITFNRCFKGGRGIYAEGTPIIEHNLIYGNINSGIYLKDVSGVKISSNTIANNGHYAGGGGYTLTEDRPATGTIYDWEYNSSWVQLPYPDDDEKNIELPFDFEFYGRKFNAGDSIAVSSNGHIMMLGDIYGPGSGVTNTLDYVNHPLSWHGQNHSGSKVLGNDYFIAPLYDDHYDDDHGGDVRYTVRGTAPYRRLIVVWHEREHWNYGDGTDDGVSFEAKLFETTNVIQFHYYDMSYGNPDSLNYCKSGTIGIKMNDNIYMQYCFNSEILPNSDVPFALEYTPTPPGGSETFFDNCTNIELENNIFAALYSDGLDYFYALSSTNSNPVAKSDYNLYYANNNQYLFNFGGTKYTDLSSWPVAGANDIEGDPLFVDPDNDDYHIQSTSAGESFHNGEWPPFTAGSGTWTTDADPGSPALDAGTGEYLFEQEDNGDARNIGCYGNTVQATKTAIVQGYWTGAVSTEWDNPNNWSDHVVPDKTKDAIIPDVSSTTNRFPYITVLATCRDLEIQPGAYVIIAPDGALTVDNILKNNAGYDGLIIASDACGDGSLISTTTNVQAKVYRYFYGTRYHYISSPITTTPVNQFNLNNFYYWDASMEWYGMGPPIDYRPWITPDESSNLELFKGYAYYYYTDTIEFRGILNTGTFTATLHKYTGSLTQGGPDDQGWNLLGNPYPSSINWDLVANSASFPDPNTELESAIYLFDDYDASAEQKNYRYYVPASGTGGTYGVGTADASKYIPVGQGFFVRALQDGVTITIDNSMRSHSMQDYYKAEHHDNLVRLLMTKDESQDELVIRLIPPATTAFDPQYDARKLFVDDLDYPQFCAINSDSSISAISSLPEYTEDITVPLMIRCNAGKYTFKVKEQTLIDNRRLFLIDNELGTITELKQGTEYTFNYEGGINTTRFALKFSENHAPYVVNAPQNQTVYEDNDFIIHLGNIFADQDNDPLTVNIKVNGSLLPHWLGFDENTLTLFGIPTNYDVGTYDIMLTASDVFGEKASVSFVLTVENTNDEPIVSGQIPDYETIAGEELTFKMPKSYFTDIDPDDHLTITLENLPSWLKIVDDEYVTGIPGIEDVGTYEITATATDEAGASVSQTFNVVVLPVTGQDISQAGIVIAPNPTAGLIKITAGFKNYKLWIVNINGKIVLTKEIVSDNAEVDLSALPAGTYKIILQHNDSFYTGKIVKQ